MVERWPSIPRLDQARTGPLTRALGSSPLSRSASTKIKTGQLISFAIFRTAPDLKSTLATWYRTQSHRRTVNPERKHRNCLVATYQPNAPHRLYNTTLRSIIPLPDPNAPTNSASHPSAYPIFPAGATVMALYPDTSCFYRAEVLASPSDMHPAGRVSSFRSCEVFDPRHH